MSTFKNLRLAAVLVILTVGYYSPPLRADDKGPAGASSRLTEIEGKIAEAVRALGATEKKAVALREELAALRRKAEQLRNVQQATRRLEQLFEGLPETAMPRDRHDVVRIDRANDWLEEHAIGTLVEFEAVLYQRPSAARIDRRDYSVSVNMTPLVLEQGKYRFPHVTLNDAVWQFRDFYHRFDGLSDEIAERLTQLHAAKLTPDGSPPSSRMTVRGRIQSIRLLYSARLANGKEELLREIEFRLADCTLVGYVP
jgi:hypothetical protein